MQLTMLKSKIHRAVLTGLELEYEGSISIDRDLMDRAHMLPGEQVQVLNLNNGKRLTTYIIEAPRGSGTMMLNGPAARLGMVGDRVIVIAYALMDEKEARDYVPTVVKVDPNNVAIN
jgi:aspartate 1-decarboxylase